MAEPIATKKRVRGRNYSVSENEIIKECIKDSLHILEAKHCNGTSKITKKMQDRVWEDICSKVNAVGVTQRTVTELKEKWNNMKKAAKKEVNRQKRHMNGTGGGPPAPSCGILADIADMYRESPAFHGISLDSETIVLSIPDTQSVQNDEGGELVAQLVDASGDHESNTVETCYSPTSPVDLVDLTNGAGVSSGVTNISRKNGEKKSLKDLQMEFYTIAAANERERAKLMVKKMDVYNMQTETLTKVNCLLDKLIEKINHE